MYEGLIARRSFNGRTQSIHDHVKNVAEISDSISQYPKTSRLISILHDIGKLSTAFQKYIGDGGERGSVIHAWQGAFLGFELLHENSSAAVLIKEIISFCVTAHHNHLDDGVSPNGETDLFDKFTNINDDKYYFDEIRGKVTDRVKSELQTLFDEACLEINDLLMKIKEVYHDKNSANFALGLFIKYMFSCLVDADRLDAYLFSINEVYSYQSTNWEILASKFENNISQFTNKSKIDAIRKSVSDKCKAAADKEPGIYQLSVPTGGGKTLSSLRFALHHCKKYGKKRIIYVIPYLSIIDQTARNLCDILDLPDNNEVIFEHHSNILEPDDADATEIRKIAAVRWDNPIILTTMVQFMETVMSSKSGRLRKFASMSDSVIIFDEIQSMPIKTIHCFNEVVSFLTKILKTTVILCSATQPTLETTQRKNLLSGDNAKLIDCTEDFKSIKRVTVSAKQEQDYEEASAFILEKANLKGNCLVIVNTKETALEIYNRLINISTHFHILHLSTSMCSSHRIQVISKMKSHLRNQRKVICVSTQLIEAGVDISFSCVVRAMSGLDSIAQAAGRCNRNGESDVPQTVYTFPLKGENLDKLMDIKLGKELTARIVQYKPGDSDLLDETIMKSYYQKFFAGKDSQMDYPTKDGETVYAMLSGNDYGKQNYVNRTGSRFSHYISHAFYTADMNFSVIDRNTKSVVALFGQSENLLEEYRNHPVGIFTKRKIRILKELQKYTLSLYEWQMKKLTDQKAVSIFDQETGIFILNKNYYSSETGIVLNPNQENLIV